MKSKLEREQKMNKCNSVLTFTETRVETIGILCSVLASLIYILEIFKTKY